MLYVAEQEGAVDLRFARAYVPICTGCVQLVFILLFVASVPASPAYSWLLVAILVHVQRHIRTEVIFECSTLMLAIALASLMNEYRTLNVAVPRLQGGVNLLWVTHFTHVCASAMQPTKRVPVEHAMWVCHGLLLVMSLFTAPMPDTWHDALVRPVIFFVGCVSWLYAVDHAQLSYDRVYDGRGLLLRFSVLLFTPLVVSSLLLVITVALCACVNLHWQYPWRTDSETKKHDDLLPSSDDEVFRLAKSVLSQVGESAA